MHRFSLLFAAIAVSFCLAACGKVADGESSEADAAGERGAGGDADGAGADAHPPDAGTTDAGAADDERPKDDASDGGHAKEDADGVACRSSSDCVQPSVGFECVGPYNNVACVCDRSAIASCTQDSQCDAGTVCREDPAVPNGCLGPSGLVCAAPCSTDLDCAPTDECEDGGHCQPRTCAQCPSYFSCKKGACIIPSCTTDPECPGGYCVNGSCAASLGVCEGVCA